MELPSVSCSEEAGVRYLHLGDTPWVQGCMRVRKPYAVELEYVQRMLGWLLWHDVGDPATLERLHTVQLGLGAASLSKFCAQVLGSENTAVEINEAVISICRAWFALAPDNYRQRVLCMDALTWAQDFAHAASADALMIDLYDHEADAPVLDDRAFYAACRHTLKEGGMASINLFGRSHAFARSLKILTEVFGRDQVWHFAPTREGNAIVLAGRSVPQLDADTLQMRAALLRAQYQFKTTSWLKALKSA